MKPHWKRYGSSTAAYSHTGKKTACQGHLANFFLESEVQKKRASDSLADDKYPMQEAEQLVIDAVNVGLAAMHKAPEKTERSRTRLYDRPADNCGFHFLWISDSDMRMCKHCKKAFVASRKGNEFSARSTRTSLMSTNQEKRKRGIKEQSIFLSGVNCRKNTRNQKAGKASWAQMQKLVQHCVYNGE